MSVAKQKRLTLIAMLAIPTILLAIFVIYPLVNMIVLSFQKWDGSSAEKVWVWFRNYKKLFMNSPVSWKALLNNGLYLFFGLAIIPLQILISGILTSRIRGSSFYKTMIFLPYIINSVAIGYAFSFFFSPVSGGFNGILRALHCDFLIHNWLSDERIVNYTLNFVSYWKVFGFNIVLLSAALTSVSEDQLESASVEGANIFQKLWYIQIPQIGKTISIIVFMTIAGSLQVFDIPFVMTSGGPNYASTTFSMYAVNLAFQYEDYGLAAAMAVVLIIFILIINSLPKIAKKIIGGIAHATHNR